MAYLIELGPEEEARLLSLARSRGIAPEQLASELLARDLHQEPAEHGVSDLLPVVDEDGVFHARRWDAIQERMRGLFSGRPVLSDAELTREVMYRDHE